MTPTFQGEVQFAGYSDSSRNGPRITLRLAERDDLAKFIGEEGGRFMAVLVRIGDDEQPAEPKQRERIGPYCYQAVKWCSDPEFQAWLAAQHPPLACDADAKWAEIAVKQICGVDSRKELDTDDDARRRWHDRIAGPYHKHLIARGMVA